MKGSRKCHHGVYPKGYDPILKGDTVAFYRARHGVQGVEWVIGESFTVCEKFELSWSETPCDCVVAQVAQSDTEKWFDIIVDIL